MVMKRVEELFLIIRLIDITKPLALDSFYHITFIAHRYAFH